MKEFNNCLLCAFFLHGFFCFLFWLMCASTIVYIMHNFIDPEEKFFRFYLFISWVLLFVVSFCVYTKYNDSTAFPRRLSPDVHMQCKKDSGSLVVWKKGRIIGITIAPSWATGCKYLCMSIFGLPDDAFRIIVCVSCAVPEVAAKEKNVWMQIFSVDNKRPFLPFQKRNRNKFFFTLLLTSSHEQN